jgi:hypothetical protein
MDTTVQKITLKNSLKYLERAVNFRILAVTTNNEKNADSFQFSNLPYISRAGGWLRQLRCSWLFNAFPGFSFLSLSAIKNNHI